MSLSVWVAYLKLQGQGIHSAVWQFHRKSLKGVAGQCQSTLILWDYILASNCRDINLVTVKCSSSPMVAASDIIWFTHFLNVTECFLLFWELKQGVSFRSNEVHGPRNVLSLRTYNQGYNGVMKKKRNSTEKFICQEGKVIILLFYYSVV